MCLKSNHQRVHQIVTSPGCKELDIYLGEDHTTDDSEGTSDILIRTLRSKKPDTVQGRVTVKVGVPDTIVTKYANRIQQH